MALIFHSDSADLNSIVRGVNRPATEILTKNDRDKEMNKEMMKINDKKNNSHGAPNSLLSFASDDFWYKEPEDRKGWCIGGRAGEGRWQKRDDKNQI